MRAARQIGYFLWAIPRQNLGLRCQAIIKPLRLDDPKAWRLLFVEWAQRYPVLARLFQIRQIPANHADNILIGAIHDMLRNAILFAAHFAASARMVSRRRTGIFPRDFQL